MFSHPKNDPRSAIPGGVDECLDSLAGLRAGGDRHLFVHKMSRRRWPRVIPREPEASACGS